LNLYPIFILLIVEYLSYLSLNLYPIFILLVFEYLSYFYPEDKQDKNRIKIQRDARQNQWQKLSQTTTRTDNIYSHKIVLITFIAHVLSCPKMKIIELNDGFSLIILSYELAFLERIYILWEYMLSVLVVV
jgi:cell division protein FtsB